uniref:Uncharacterized protein n=1 Tax=Panagrolaimus sp. JU765 TaxID=591449 RepID=A0AC34REC7_9BILA
MTEEFRYFFRSAITETDFIETLQTQKVRFYVGGICAGYWQLKFVPIVPNILTDVKFHIWSVYPGRMDTKLIIEDDFDEYPLAAKLPIGCKEFSLANLTTEKLKTMPLKFSINLTFYVDVSNDQLVCFDCFSKVYEKIV